jgi:hypothetical protein
MISLLVKAMQCKERKRHVSLSFRSDFGISYDIRAREATRLWSDEYPRNPWSFVVFSSIRTSLLGSVSAKVESADSSKLSLTLILVNDLSEFLETELRTVIDLMPRENNNVHSYVIKEGEWLISVLQNLNKNRKREYKVRFGRRGYVRNIRQMKKED